MEKINEMYLDAFLMRSLGNCFLWEWKQREEEWGGSTQNILDFIKQRVQESLDRNVVTIFNLYWEQNQEW